MYIFVDVSQDCIYATPTKHIPVVRRNNCIRGMLRDDIKKELKNWPVALDWMFIKKYSSKFGTDASLLCMAIYICN